MVSRCGSVKGKKDKGKLIPSHYSYEVEYSWLMYVCIFRYIYISLSPIGKSIDIELKSPSSNTSFRKEEGESRYYQFEKVH